MKRIVARFLCAAFLQIDNLALMKLCFTLNDQQRAMYDNSAYSHTCTLAYHSSQLDARRLTIYATPMIAIGHTSVGVVLGIAAAELLPASIPLPILVMMVGAAGAASHYATDLIPHGHYNMNLSTPSRKETLTLLLDVVAPVLLIGVFLLVTEGFGAVTWLVGAGIVGAQLPDVMMGLRRRNFFPSWNWLLREADFHSSTHWHNPEDLDKATNEGGRRLGASDVWQLGMVGLAVFMLLRWVSV